MAKVTTSKEKIDLLNTAKGSIVAMVASEHPDLSLRQMGVLLTVYMDDETQHTVRGLAAILHVSKPAITRALDRLTEHGFVARKTDPNDRRSIIVQKRPAGQVFVNDFATMLVKAANDGFKQAA